MRVSPRRFYNWLPTLIIVMAILAVSIGALALAYVKNRLIATTGESLALAAADIADKLDRILYEHYRHIQAMAHVPVFQGRDQAAMASYLQQLKKDYPRYMWVGSTDKTGRIVASTDLGSVGKDWSGRRWFRNVHDWGGVDAQDAQVVEESGGVPVVLFTAPLTGPQGQFLGIVTTMVGLPVLEDVFDWTVRAFQIQRGEEGRLEWQFLTRDGDVILDFPLRQEGKVNLRELGVLSALFAGSAQPGYVEEEHRRRHVAVVTGYAQTEGYGMFTGLHWGVLVRMDRSAILAPIQRVLLILGLAGALVFIPMLGFLSWATRRVKLEWTHTQEREEWLSTTLSSIGDAVIATDERGRVTFMNPVAQSLTGWRLEDAKGRALNHVFAIVNEATQQPAEDPVTKVIREGTIVGLANHTVLIAKDGSQRPIDDSGAPIRNARGDVIGVILVFRDISETKQREKELQYTEEQLRQSQKMEAVGKLAGGIAHDFNNLLTAITGYSDLLLGHVPPDSLARRNVEEIRKAALRAGSLTHQLLAFSRRQVLAPKVLDLNAVVTNLEPLLRRLIGEDIELSSAPSPILGRVLADPGQIEQIILNLVVNARDAMPRGGRLTIETANVELDEAYASQHVTVQPGRYVMLAVSDTGVGMDAATQLRIFEPFFTTKEPGKGTGLGLSTVYGIVKQSGGYIWVYSEPRRGATFKIYLPRSEGTPEVLEPVVAPAKAFVSTETILLVEDDEAVRELVRGILEEKGYAVLVACRSEEAFKLNGQHEGPIHLLLSDVVMPTMSGPELAERLKSSRPRMKVLYMSGYTDDAVVRLGVLTEGTPFLQKPFTPNALLHKVHEVLGTSARERWA
ncbi:MAG: PAS domain S-box protein [Nitrospirae bacterium]|nr:MAG: PAS domain S-box protein [Nitrospirota bacterium]